MYRECGRGMCPLFCKAQKIKSNAPKCCSERLYLYNRPQEKCVNLNCCTTCTACHISDSDNAYGYKSRGGAQPPFTVKRVWLF